MKKVVSLLLAAVFISMYPVAYGESGISKNNSGPIWYIWQDCNIASGWEVNDAAASSSKIATKEVMHVGLFNDSSQQLPTEINREITPVSSGKLTLEFDFALDRQMDGTGFRLLDGTQTAFGIVTQNSGIYLEQPKGEKAYLASFSTSRIIDSYTYGIKAVVNIDTGMTEEIYVNGALCASNLPFANKVKKITSFDMSTTDQAVGNVLIRYLKLYGGYDVYEMFLNGSGLPEDWTKTGDGAAGLRVFNYRYVDRNSLELNSVKGDVAYTKTIRPHTGKITFEAQLLLPQKRSGIEILLLSGDEEVFKIQADENSFLYGGQNGADTPFYDYLGNLWYHFKADLDLDAHTAALYLNGKQKAAGIPVGTSGTVDKIVLRAGQGASTAVFDDIILYNTPEEPGDYVPVPEQVSSDEYAIGMQMCPLWTEGTHNGWENIQSAPGRTPLLGYYDEGSPEYADWAIKYMAEHGIDFWLPCMYTCYALEEAERDPIKDNSFRHGYAIHNGYFNAKYSDRMPFAILWENGGYSGARATQKDFFENLVPFWIEYYFKDPRYFKLNGRPVMSILTPGNFFSLFEGNTENDEAVLQGVQKFRDMCIEAGVGDPILMINTGQGNIPKELQERWDRLGIEGFSKYNYGVSGNVEQYKAYLNTYRDNNQSNATLEIFPCLAMGFNGLPWESAATGYTSTPEEYEDFLRWVKEEYMPTLPKSKFEKRVMVAATWDEFGEGTVLCPTEQFGFGHLDAIRNVFIGEGKHEDVVPTAEQKARINKLYKQDGKIHRTMEYVLPDAAAQEVLQQWDFSDGMHGWEVGSVSEIAYEDGAAVLTLSGTGPTVALNDSNIDLYNINYIKVTMQSGVSKGGTVSWTTDLDQNVTNRKYRVFPSRGVQNGEYTEYYIPIGENYLWKGLLKNLNITLGQFYNTDEKVKLKSIAFLGNPKEQLGYKIKSNGHTAAVNVIQGEDTVLLDLKTAAEECGAEYAEFVKDGTVFVRAGGGNAIVKPDSAQVIKNGEIVPISSAPVKHDGSIYVTAAAFSKITGISLSYHEETKTFEQASVAAESNDAQREVLGEYLFETTDDIAGMTFNGHMSSKGFENGGLNVNISGNDPNVRLPAMAVDAAAVKRIAVTMASSVASTGQIYFIKSNDSTYNEAKSIKFSVMSGEEPKVYYLNCEASPQWDGTITQFRFDPVGAEGVGAKLKLVSVQLLGDVMEGAGKRAEQSCLEKTENAYTWNFTQNTALDGFAPSKHVADMRVENGELCFSASGSKPMIETRPGLRIDANRFRQMQIRLKNTSAGDKIKVYFYKNAFGILDSQGCVEAAIKPNDEDGSVYTIDLSQNSRWEGEIKGLVLEFPAGITAIDYIKLEVRE